jgi:hypothetical protein
MSNLRHSLLTLAISAAAVGVAQAQTPLSVTAAELAVPFCATQGQMAFLATQILFVATESPSSSLTIDRADISNVQRSGDVVVVTTRRKLVDADGSRDTFRFRMAQPDALLNWYESTPASAATGAGAPRAPMAGSGTAKIIASYQARHDHTIGSCQGTLILTDEGVSYESNDKLEDSRQWKLIDIKKVDQNGVYKLKVEPFRGGDFNFELFGTGIDSGEFRALLDRIARARRTP